jgi:hypothetical protein
MPLEIYWDCFGDNARRVHAARPAMHHSVQEVTLVVVHT